MIFKCGYCKKDFSDIKKCEECEDNCRKIAEEKTVKENQRKEDLAKIEKTRKELAELVNDYNKKYFATRIISSNDFNEQATKILSQIFDLL